MNHRLYKTITKWQAETFTNAVCHDYAAKLIEEANELATALNDLEKPLTDVKREIADCFIVLFGLANSLEMDWAELSHEVRSKFTDNLNRKFEKVNGVYKGSK